MKKSLLIFTLLFSTLMFSSASYAEWTKVTENVNGTYYVDFARIGKYADYIKFWELQIAPHGMLCCEGPRCALPLAECCALSGRERPEEAAVEAAEGFVRQGGGNMIQHRGP